MSSIQKHPAPGAWYQTYLEEDDQPVIGILVRSADKAALFDALFESGHFEIPYAQAREKFLLAPPGRPVYVPESTLEKTRQHFDINPGKAGALYKNELEAHRAQENPTFPHALPGAAQCHRG